MQLTYCPTTKTFRSRGRKVTFSGRRGVLRWIEEYHKNGKPKLTRSSSTEDHLVMRGGPWNGAKVRRRLKSGKGTKATYADVQLPDLWFCESFDGWYEYRPVYDDYYWLNP